MLIKCPDCNHENQLGAIFCRNCGSKLDIDKLEPKVTDKAGVSPFKIIRHIILLLLVLALIGLCGGIFAPMGYKNYTPPAEDQQKEINKEMSAIFKRIRQRIGRKFTFVFTPEQASFAYNSSFLEKIKEDQGSGYYIDDLIFDVDSNHKVNLILKTRLGGKIPVRFTLIGLPTSNFDDDGSLGFQITGAKVGHIPVPGALWHVVTEKFNTLTDGENISQLLKSIESVDIDEQNNFVVNLKKPARRKRSARKK